MKKGYLVLADGQAYPLCDGLGGYGFLNAVPCDPPEQPVATFY